MSMFLTISRLSIKPGKEMEARKLLKEELTTQNNKLSDVVPGLLGCGLMRSSKDESIYAVASVWRSAEDFHDAAKHPEAKKAAGLPKRLAELCDGVIAGEGFHIQSL